MEKMNLIELAKEAREQAYAPYSKFKVGCAILLKNGQVIKGSNVENVSYGLTMCAERNALNQLYNLGYRKEDIKEIAVIADTENPISPCGACRQVMLELAKPETLVTLSNMKDKKVVYQVKDLLPFAFVEVENV